jgi:hypothetical protein
LRDLAFAALFLTAPELAAAQDVMLKAEIGGDAQHTRFVAFLSRQVEYRIFSISDPYRIVIDLPETEVQVPDVKRGLVASSRSGRLAAGQSRIVIDLTEPAVVEKSQLLPPENGVPARLIIELVKSKRRPPCSRSSRHKWRRRARIPPTSGRSSSSIQAMAAWMPERSGARRPRPRKRLRSSFAKR